MRAIYKVESVLQLCTVIHMQNIIVLRYEYNHKKFLQYSNIPALGWEYNNIT